MSRKLAQLLVRRDFFIPFFLVLASFSIGLVSLYFFQFVGSDGGGDGVVHAFSGRNLFSGNGFSVRGGPQLDFPPLYPILIGISWFISRNLEFSGQIVSVIASSLLVIPVYYLARNMYGKRVALISALFIIVCPPLVFASTEIRTEALYTLLLATSVSLGWKALRTRNLLWALLTGLAIGSAFLAYPMGIVLVPLFLFFFLLSKYFALKLSKTRILAKMVVLVASFVIVSLPYWAFLHRHMGKWVITGSSPYRDFARVQLLKVDEEKMSFLIYERPSAERYKQSQGGMLQYAITHPGEVLSKCMKNLASIYPEMAKDAQKLKIPLSALKVFLVLFFLFIGLGLLKLAWSRKLTIKEFYLGLVLISASAFLLFHVETRYFYPYLPFFIIGLARVTVGFQGWVEKKLCGFNRFFAFVAGFMIPGILFAGMASASAIIIVKKQSLVPYEYKIMGLWMKENMENITNKLIMLRKAGVAFYAGSRWKGIYYGDYSGLVKYARSNHVDYLIIDEFTIPRLRPQFAFLLDEKRKHPGLQVVHVIKYKGRKIILYQVLPPKNDKG